jgi:hypothetical protein
MPAQGEVIASLGEYSRSPGARTALIRIGRARNSNSVRPFAEAERIVGRGTGKPQMNADEFSMLAPSCKRH